MALTHAFNDRGFLVDQVAKYHTREIILLMLRAAPVLQIFSIVALYIICDIPIWQLEAAFHFYEPISYSLKMPENLADLKITTDISNKPLKQNLLHKDFDLKSHLLGVAAFVLTSVLFTLSK
uniref:Uncharacterized protein n=1 Tax=Halamphora calidilacuna TaxID=2133758 RepID=A0A2R4A3Q5_9STRA|nr:hypothetical protein [Halamphora calidilacuna]